MLFIRRFKFIEFWRFQSNSTRYRWIFVSRNIQSKGKTLTFIWIWIPFYFVSIGIVPIVQLWDFTININQANIWPINFSGCNSLIDWQRPSGWLVTKCLNWTALSVFRHSFSEYCWTGSRLYRRVSQNQTGICGMTLIWERKSSSESRVISIPYRRMIMFRW